MVDPKAQLETANIARKVMTEVVAQHLVRSGPNVGKRTISELSVKAMVQVINMTKAGLGLRKARRARSFMR